MTVTKLPLINDAAPVDHITGHKWDHAVTKSKIWVDEYRDQRAIWQCQHLQERERRRLEAQAHNHLLNSAAQSEVLFVADVQAPYLHTRPLVKKPPGTIRHNDHCEETGVMAFPGQRMECNYCEVVVRSSRAEALHAKSTGWACWVCSADMRQDTWERTDNQLQKEYMLRLAKSAQLIQRRFRGLVQRIEFLRTRQGMIILQCHTRGKRARQEGAAAWGSVKRPMRLKVLYAENLRPADDDGNSDPFVIASMFDGSDVYLDRQQFRYDTKVKRATLYPVWNESIILPAVDYSSVLAFTVVDTDDDDDHTMRDDFLGQASLRMSEGNVLRSGGEFTLPMDSLEITPRDFHGHVVRFGEENIRARGSITVRVELLPSLTSACGYIRELESSVPGASGNRWWACLADGYMKLYKPGNLIRPKICIYVRKCTSTTMCLSGGKERAVFDVRTSDHVYIFEATSIGRAREWQTKIRCSMPKEQEKLDDKYNPWRKAKTAVRVLGMLRAFG